jgi:hypothetical protein
MVSNSAPSPAFMPATEKVFKHKLPLLPDNPWDIYCHTYVPFNVPAVTRNVIDNDFGYLSHLYHHNVISQMLGSICKTTCNKTGYTMSHTVGQRTRLSVGRII